MTAKKRLGEMLVEQVHLTLAQLEEALEVQSRPGEKRLLGQILIGRGHVSTAQIQVALAKQRAITRPLE